jgi:hypothetical protein
MDPFTRSRSFTENFQLSPNTSFTSSKLDIEIKENRVASIINEINERVKKIKIRSNGRRKSFIFEVISNIQRKSRCKTDCDFIAEKRICLEKAGYVSKKRNNSLLYLNKTIRQSKQIDYEAELFKTNTNNNGDKSKFDESKRRDKSHSLLNKLTTINNGDNREYKKTEKFERQQKSMTSDFRLSFLNDSNANDKTHDFFDIVELDYENENLVVVTDKSEEEGANEGKILPSNLEDNDIKIQIFNVNNNDVNKKENSSEIKKLKEHISDTIDLLNEEHLAKCGDNITHTAKLNSLVNNVKIESFSVTLSDIMEANGKAGEETNEARQEFKAERNPLTLSYSKINKKHSFVIVNNNSEKQLALMQNLDEHRNDFSKERLLIVRTRYSYCFIFLFYNNSLYSDIVKRLKINDINI